MSSSRRARRAPRSCGRRSSAQGASRAGQRRRPTRRSARRPRIRRARRRRYGSVWSWARCSAGFPEAQIRSCLKHVSGRDGERRKHPTVSDTANSMLTLATEARRINRSTSVAFIDTLISRAVTTFARLWTGVRPDWRGCAPEPGQRIYFANHASHGDFVLIWAVLPRELRDRTRPVAGADYWRRGRLRPFLGGRVFRAVLIDREAANRTEDPIRQMAAALDAGDSLILLPEGTRNTTTIRFCRSNPASTISRWSGRASRSSRPGSITSPACFPSEFCRCRSVQRDLRRADRAAGGRGAEGVPRTRAGRAARDRREVVTLWDPSIHAY